MSALNNLASSIETLNTITRENGYVVDATPSQKGMRVQVLDGQGNPIGSREYTYDQLEKGGVLEDLADRLITGKTEAEIGSEKTASALGVLEKQAGIAQKESVAALNNTKAVSGGDTIGKQPFNLEIGRAHV